MPRKKPTPAAPVHAEAARLATWLWSQFESCSRKGCDLPRLPGVITRLGVQAEIERTLGALYANTIAALAIADELAYRNGHYHDCPARPRVAILRPKSAPCTCGWADLVSRFRALRARPPLALASTPRGRTLRGIPIDPQVVQRVFTDWEKRRISPAVLETLFPLPRRLRGPKRADGQG